MDYTHSLKSERTVYEFLPHVDRNEIGESPPPPFQCDAVAFCSERIKDRLTTAAAAGPEKEIYCIATSFPFPPRIFREIGSSIAAAVDLGRRRIITEAINRQRGGSCGKPQRYGDEVSAAYPRTYVLLAERALS